MRVLHSGWAVSATILSLTIISSARAQELGIVRVEVHGETAQVTIDRYLKFPYNPTAPLGDGMTADFTVTFLKIGTDKVELRNPIVGIKYHRFVFKDSHDAPRIGGVRVIYTPASNPKWVVKAMDSAGVDLEGTPCYKDCAFSGETIRLYGTVDNPPCCPTSQGGYDCENCINKIDDGSEAFADPYRRTTRRPSLLAWLRRRF